MSNEKLIKLIEAMASAGYEIIYINCYHDYDIKILLRPIKKKKPFSKENISILINIFSDMGYNINEYELPKIFSRNIKFVLYV